MRGLIGVTVALSFAGFTQQANACAAPERSKPYAQTLADQVDARQRADQIILAEVVEGVFPNGRKELFYQTVVSLTEAGTSHRLEPVTSSSCGPFRRIGDLVLIYYRRVQVRESSTSRDFWVESRALSTVDVRENVDPEIGPMLQEAARRERARAQLLR